MSDFRGMECFYDYELEGELSSFRKKEREKEKEKEKKKEKERKKTVPYITDISS